MVPFHRCHQIMSYHLENSSLMLNLCVYVWGCEFVKLLVCEGEQAHVCLCMCWAVIHVLCLQPLQLIVEKSLSLKVELAHQTGQ